MSRTKVINEKTGVKYPEKTRFKKKKSIKYLGTSYPLELRPRSVIRQKIADDELIELLSPSH
jgi:hypothetical protein